MSRKQKTICVQDYLSTTGHIKKLVSKSNKVKVTASFKRNLKVEKNDALYTAHSYPTKVPPEGIIPYIKHYSQPGDTILDPFSGSGMTGVAVRLLSAERSERRNVILNDLGSAACHITYNHNNPVDPALLAQAYDGLRNDLIDLESLLYSTWHPLNNFDLSEDLSWSTIQNAAKRARAKGEGHVVPVKRAGKHINLVQGKIVTTIWSEVYACPLKQRSGNTCNAEVVLWDEAMDQKAGRMSKKFPCPKCKGELSRRAFRSLPTNKAVWIVYEYQDPSSKKFKRHARRPYKFDHERLIQIQAKKIPYWVPSQDILPQREMMTMGPAKLGIRKVSDFYTRRNLHACAAIWDAISKLPNARIRQALAFACTNTFWHATRMRRFNVKGGMRPLTGTLYVPQISAECNVFQVLDHKIEDLKRFYAEIKSHPADNFALVQGSATKLKAVTNDSIDYIFTDPPFGGNIYYSDCAIIWEGWLNSFTAEEHEIHFNRVRKPENGGKTREKYAVLVRESYQEMYRVLKPGRWASIVFNNSDDEVLNVFRQGAIEAGFEIQEVLFLDKDQKSVKGYLGRNGTQQVTNCDFVLTLRKPATARVSHGTIARFRAANDKLILNKIVEYLEDLPSKVKKQPETFTEEHRTSPFLHSMLVRRFLSENRDLSGLSLTRITAICRQNLLEMDGQWFLPDAGEVSKAA
jgi:DNA modification methylase